MRGGNVASQTRAASLLRKKRALSSRTSILAQAAMGRQRATRAVLFQLSEGELEVAPVVSPGAATGYWLWSGTFSRRSLVLVGIALFTASSAGNERARKAFLYHPAPSAPPPFADEIFTMALKRWR